MTRQISALNAPFSSALNTAILKTTALWIGFWWALMSRILPWINAPTANPSARSNFGGGLVPPSFFLTERANNSMIVESLAENV